MWFKVKKIEGEGVGVFDRFKSEISRGKTHTLRFVIRVNVAYSTIFL
jgi:hypothetical protein